MKWQRPDIYKRSHYRRTSARNTTPTRDPTPLERHGPNDNERKNQNGMMSTQPRIVTIAGWQREPKRTKRKPTGAHSQLTYCKKAIDGRASKWHLPCTMADPNRGESHCRTRLWISLAPWSPLALANFFSVIRSSLCIECHRDVQMSMPTITLVCRDHYILSFIY